MTSEKKKKELHRWLISLIDVFRTEFDKLTAEEKKKVSNHRDYRSPCQIEVFWIGNPLEYQILITTHREDLSDKQIIINGPYESHEFIEKVESVMNEDRWEKEIPKDAPSLRLVEGTVKYADVFADRLKNFMHSIERSVFLKLKEGMQGGSIFIENSWCEYFYGNISETNCDMTVQKIMQEIKASVESSKQSVDVKISSENKPIEKLKAYGAFCYPPIWIGEKPEQSFRQKMFGDPYSTRLKICQKSFNGTEVILYSNYFISVITDNRELALRILNTIFGVSYIFGISCFAVRESELIELSLNPDSHVITSSSAQISSLRNTLMFSPTSLQAYHRMHVKEIDVNEIMDKAKLLNNNQDICNKLVFLLEGYTCFTSGEFPQSFIMNWLIIEQEVDSLWEEFLQEKKIIGKRKEGLQNHSKWTVHTKLETLNLAGRINAGRYTLINDFRTCRNDFVHKQKPIDENTSKNLLNITFDILKLRVVSIMQNSSAR